MKFRHKIAVCAQSGGVYVNILENYHDLEYADWALLSPRDAGELRDQIDTALANLKCVEKNEKPRRAVNDRRVEKIGD